MCLLGWNLEVVTYSKKNTFADPNNLQSDAPEVVENVNVKMSSKYIPEKNAKS